MSFIELNPAGYTSPTIIFFVLIISIIWSVLMLYSLKKNGWKKTLRYFVPMMVAAFFIEASAVATGRYQYPGYILYFSVLGGSVPFIILLGWSVNLFLFLSCAKQILAFFFQKITIARMILISAVTGCIGVFLDLLEDPIAHHNQWWVWTEQSPLLTLFGVPITNFFDWFIILFFMALVTQLIDHASLSENRKLLISFISISYVGAAIYLAHTALIMMLAFF